MGEKINNILKGEIISSVFYVLLGLCLILIPTQTVDVICKVVFGLILIGVGIYHIYIYIRGKVSATIMDLLSGVVVFVLGVFLFMTPSIVIKLLPWMLGAFVLVDSLWKFKGTFLLKKGGQKSWSALLIGSLIFIALGIVILFGRFPKIMTLLIFSGWVLVCDGVVDIILFIVMKLGLRKIAKKATAENGPQDAAETHEETIAEWAETPAGSEKTKKSGRKFLGRKKKDAADDVSDEVAENAAVVSAEKADSQEQSEDESENIYDDKPLTSKDAVTDGIGSSETSGKFQNTRWENEPQSAEMKLWDVGEDQAETGSLKEFLNNSDEEELEEWKD